MVIKEEDFPSATFEEKMTILLKMSDEEKKRSAEQIPYMCLCSKCPSSEVIKEQKGCLCNQCPISKTMSMRWDHYCIRGDAMQLSDTEKG
ncbi:MAG: DUF2769 domain-containing protein [Candidatus Heimdallarchaeaceae archaeon]